MHSARCCRYGAGWGVCAAGSGQPLGTFFGASTVFEEPPGFYTAEPCGG
jgi:hypothetical protein